jgi:hypothetical protein
VEKKKKDLVIALEETPLLECFTNGDCRKLKRLSVCCSDVEINDGALITCSLGSCSKVVNKSNAESRRESLIHVPVLFIVCIISHKRSVKDGTSVYYDYQPDG